MGLGMRGNIDLRRRDEAQLDVSMFGSLGFGTALVFMLTDLSLWYPGPSQPTAQVRQNALALPALAPGPYCGTTGLGILQGWLAWDTMHYHPEGNL